MKLSTSPTLVTVFGGSGFIGRHVVRTLANKGYQVRVAVRRPDLAGHLKPLGNVGQIHLVQANLRYPASVKAAARNADYVVNLVGTFDRHGKNNFEAVQVLGAKNIAEAAREVGAGMVHVSATGADPASSSAYGETKARGEHIVKSIVKKAIILRPSVVFGPEDEFFNRFGAMSRLSPALPLIGGGKTLFQPVYVGDVADAVTKAVSGEAKEGKTYELGGPRTLTFRECLELLLQEVGRKRFFAPVPWLMASVMGKLIGWLPGAPITADQVEMLKTDNVVSEAAVTENRTLEGLGIQPTPMSAILPTYLVQYRPSGQFTKIGREET